MGDNTSSAYNYIRSKFVIARGMRELIKKHKLKIKYGVFAKDEAQLVERTLNKFLADRGLSMDDFKRGLVEGGDFPIKELVYECTQACESRTYHTMFNHLAYSYHPDIRKRIEADEEIQLLDLVNQKGFKWKEIGYHLSKYKDLCQRKYLSMIGENSRSLTKRRIEGLLTRMPATDEEWGVVCREMRLKRPTIVRAINRFLNGKRLCEDEGRNLEIQLCILILKGNHYCRFNCDVERILGYLEGDEILDITNGGDPNVVDGGDPDVVDVGDLNVANGGDPNVVDGDDLNVVNGGDPNVVNENHPNTSSEEIRGTQSRFLARFLIFFNLADDFNLDVPINKDDIFWYNITRDLNLPKSLALTKFNQLSAMYGWRTFQDIYDTVVKIAYDYAVVRIKQLLIEKSQARSMRDKK